MRILLDECMPQQLGRLFLELPKLRQGTPTLRWVPARNVDVAGQKPRFPVNLAHFRVPEPED